MARIPTASPSGGPFLTVIKIGLYVALLGLIALAVAVSITYSQLPSYRTLTKTSDLGQTIRMRAANGQVLVSMGPSVGKWLTYDQIPAEMRAAMIAVEDKRFRSHVGVDPLGIARSFKVRLQTGSFSQGGSTITQQLARNIFLTNSRTFGRKIKEAVVALALELKFSKNQILELYLNRVYFGGGAYGIDAASTRFFGHGAERLSLGEAAIIAGLVKAPSNYSPTADIEAARGRSGVVLNSMVENGFVSPDVAATVEPADIKIQRANRENSVRYFTDWALPQLDTLIDETSEPIDVWTTLDPTMQVAADKAVRANAPPGAQGALVSLDRDGAVRAMVGGRDYVDSIYNRAAQAKRQPGSAFKLFVYLSALESGMKPTDTIVDSPVTIDGWTPRNSTRTHQGPVTLREAFARSINTVSAKIGQQLGFSTIADMARRFGITGEISTNPSMVLGTSDVRLIDMTRAFASVSNKGVAVMPYGIRKVVTGDGRLLYQHERLEERVLVAPWVAAEMTDLLQAAVLTGTGRAAQIGRPVAGKTGTTSSNKDGWFIGFSSGLTTGVWMGRDDAKPVGGLQGGTAPARAFHDFMVRAVEGRPVEQFETKVPMPDWELDPEEEFWGDSGFNSAAPILDEFGQPFGGEPYVYDPEASAPDPTRDPSYPAPAPAGEQPGSYGQQPQPQPFPDPRQQQQRPPPPPSNQQPRSGTSTDAFQPGTDVPQ